MSALLSSLLILSLLFPTGISLSSNYYDKTCPNAESLIRKAVRDAATNDKKVPAALLRMHFHDCFIRSGGPSWVVPKGRKDGRTSLASETRQLPAPTFNISQLQQSFAQRGLSLEDLVALSGNFSGHTLGFSHCSSFKNRIHNFNSTTDVDPSINPSFAASLKSTCPANNNAKNAGVPMDPSSTSFDNSYYKLLFQQKTLFSSDKALLDFPKTKNIAAKFAGSKDAFTKAFVKSMIKMSSITGGQEVRKN
ncbi:hypothetical protein M8C21_024054, partial [Ambrosia artemisiifolia]